MSPPPPPEQDTPGVRTVSRSEYRRSQRAAMLDRDRGEVSEASVPFSGSLPVTVWEDEGGSFWQVFVGVAPVGMITAAGDDGFDARVTALSTDLPAVLYVSKSGNVARFFPFDYEGKGDAYREDHLFATRREALEALVAFVLGPEEAGEDPAEAPAGDPVDAEGAEDG